MEPYILVVTGFGAIVLLTAWLPMLMKELPLSLPMICVALGAVIFSLPGVPDLPHPLDSLKLMEHVTELVVIISLMGAGLKLDRPLKWAAGAWTWRLLGIAMPLTILLLALLGHAVLGLGAASALLLAAAIAPTDPVLAGDVQVGPPREGGEDDVRFALTSEAGLNDGLAFPFVNLALALALVETQGSEPLARWLLIDVVWKIAAGVAIGWLAGKWLGWLIFDLPRASRISGTGDGFVALGIACLTYGVTEMLLGYGFIAVFVAALRIREAERDHSYHETLHEFIEQLERLMLMVLLVVFGGALASGGWLRGINVEAVLYTFCAIFLIRPAAAWIALGRHGRLAERGVVSFFGIRGIGTAYYLAYGLNHGKFDDPDLLWTVTSLIVLASIVIHGTTVTPVMGYLDRGAQARRESASGAGGAG